MMDVAADAVLQSGRENPVNPRPIGMEQKMQEINHYDTMDTPPAAKRRKLDLEPLSPDTPNPSSPPSLPPQCNEMTNGNAKGVMGNVNTFNIVNAINVTPAG